MRKFKILGLILALFFVVGCFQGCAGTQQTKDGSYYEALGIWYDTGMQFKRYYEASDPATQAKWDAEFRPLLIKAKEVLDMWYIHIDDGQSGTGDLAQWKDLKNDILFYMAQNMKEKT